MRSAAPRSVKATVCRAVPMKPFATHRGSSCRSSNSITAVSHSKCAMAVKSTRCLARFERRLGSSHSYSTLPVYHPPAFFPSSTYAYNAPRILSRAYSAVRFRSPPPPHRSSYTFLSVRSDRRCRRASARAYRAAALPCWSNGHRLYSYRFRLRPPGPDRAACEAAGWCCASVRCLHRPVATGAVEANLLYEGRYT